MIIKTFASEGDIIQTLDVVALCVRGKAGDKVCMEVVVVPLICSPLENPRLDIVKDNCDYLNELSLAE